MSHEITKTPPGGDASCCEVGAETKSRVGTLGAFSAAFASVCCGLPLLLIAFGLGGLGFGSVLGKYHWYFTGVGIALLAAAWFIFLREQSRLRAAGSEIRNARLTPVLLGIATVAVLGFGALNVSSALGLGAKAREVAQAASSSSGEMAQVVSVRGGHDLRHVRVGYRENSREARRRDRSESELLGTQGARAL